MLFRSRQLSLIYSKIALPCSDARIKAAIVGFLECENDVRFADSSRTPSQRDDFRRISALLYAQIFTEVDRKIYNFEFVPKHGPGVTADGLIGNQKYRQTNWPARLEKILPSGEMLLPNWRYYDHLDEVDIIEPGHELPVKVVDVPKTLKAPRIIAIEPTAMQYAQQAVYGLILDSIESHDTLSKIIGFSDQSPNQRLAREGSLNGNLATLDLSEASDRVSNQLVRDMLHNWPHLHEAVDASRSRKAAVPGFGVIRLAKFASMGSALCFPMEAMVFMTLIFMGIEQELKRPLRVSDVKRLQHEVRVYGDDIIVPVHYVTTVVDIFESFGIRVNISKSFWTGKFRESCGREYYSGHDVSIVKARHSFPTQRKDATGIISMISLRNQLYFAGYWQTCKWLDERILEVIPHYPVVLPSSPVQGRHSFLGYETQKMDDELHRPLVKGYVVHSAIPENSLDDVGALLKVLQLEARKDLSGRRFNNDDHFDILPDVDVDHLERSGRPQAVNLKLRWSVPF